MSTPDQRRKIPSGRSGFTLVEMLAVIVVTGLLVMSLFQVFRSMTHTSRTSQTSLRAMETIHSLVQQIRSDLRNLTVPPLHGDTASLRLVVVDGDDTFTRSLHTPHSAWEEAPGDRSDRIHFHGYLPDGDLRRRASDLASERAYFAYWVNGPDSPKPKSELKHDWGILRRSVSHLNEHGLSGFTVPCLNKGDGCLKSPVLDLNTEEEYHVSGHTQVIGLHVDYLSIRLYDRVTDRWVERPDDLGEPLDRDVPDDQSPLLWDSRLLGRYPSVIELALRVYDPRTDDLDADGSRNPIRPLWIRTTITIQ